MKKIAFFLIASFILTMGDQAWAFPAILQKVLSGDTLIVREDATDLKIVIRLYGIDAPDEGQPDFGAAKEYLNTLLAKTNNYLNIVPVYKSVDKFGRLHAFVYKDGVDLNMAMVRAGQARVYDPECTLAECNRMRTEELAAKEQRKGIWWLGEAPKPWEERNREYIQYANAKEGTYEGIFYFTDSTGKVAAADPEIKYVQYIHITPPPTRVYVPVPSSQPPVYNNYNQININK